MQSSTPPTPDPASPDRQGGVGGTRRCGRASLADLRLLRRAIRCGWNVPSEGKALAPKRMVEILKDDKAGERSWVAASKTLVSMTGATLASIDVALRVRQQEEFDQRLAELEAWKDQQAVNPALGPEPRIQPVRADRENRSRREPGEADQ